MLLCLLHLLSLELILFSEPILKIPSKSKSIEFLKAIETLSKEIKFISESREYIIANYFDLLRSEAIY